MDSYEASSLIYTKVKSIDPENASKIMGYILIQDLAEKDLLRLALGSDNLLHSMVIRAKIHLGLSSSSPSSPSTLNPIARPSPPLSSAAAGNSNPFSQSSPRFLVPNGFPTASPSWALSTNSPKQYDGVRFHALSNGEGSGGGGGGEVVVDESQLSEHLSFLSEDLDFNHHDWAAAQANGDGHFHRRSFSASDAASEDFGGGGFRPCLYFARGFCKNGSTCKFVHGGGGAAAEQAEAEQLAAAAQQRAMGGLSPTVYNKYMNFILQQQQQQLDPQRAAAAMLMGEEMYKLGRCRAERNELLMMMEKMNSASRQIYLTFPAESTFKDEDVSEYFNKFGPVQDVRIPYQQKRMFGFVTFVHPETVRFILSKGNPHFICDSRVLVKPYKEKGKVLDKRQQHHQHQLERGEFSTCLSPSGIDSRDSYDFPTGGRMLYSAHESLLRRKLEQQAELQQAIELQGRRLMNLQLPPEFKSDRLQHHHNHHQRSLSLGAPVLLHHQSFSPSSHSLNLPFDMVTQEVAEGLDDEEGPVVTVTLPASVSARQHQQDAVEASASTEDLDAHRSVEQALPDNFFPSPTKSSSHRLSEFSTAGVEDVNGSPTARNETTPPLPSISSAGF